MSLVGLGYLALCAAAPLAAGLALRRLAARSGRGPLRRAFGDGALVAGAATVLYVAVFIRNVLAIRSSTGGLAFLGLPFGEALFFAAALAPGWAGALLVAGARGARLPRAAAAAAVGVLAAAAFFGAEGVRYAALERRAGDPEASAQELRAVLGTWQGHDRLYRVYAGMLARAGNTLPLARLAENPAAPEDVLLALARGGDPSVRWRALGNPGLGAESLRALHREGDAAVRAGLARNPNTPPEILRSLAEAAEPWLALDLVRHPALPAELREPLFEGLAASPDRYARNFTAAQPNAPARVLERLASDEWSLVRRTSAANRATPLETLARLARDPEPEVHGMARHMLEVRAQEAAAQR